MSDVERILHIDLILNYWNNSFCKQDICSAKAQGTGDGDFHGLSICFCKLHGLRIAVCRVGDMLFHQSVQRVVIVFCVFWPGSFCLISFEHRSRKLNADMNPVYGSSHQDFCPDTSDDILPQGKSSSTARRQQPVEHRTLPVPSHKRP